MHFVLPLLTFPQSITLSGNRPRIATVRPGPLELFTVSGSRVPQQNSEHFATSSFSFGDFSWQLYHRDSPFSLIYSMPTPNSVPVSVYGCLNSSCFVSQQKTLILRLTAIVLECTAHTHTHTHKHIHLSHPPHTGIVRSREGEMHNAFQRLNFLFCPAGLQHTQYHTHTHTSFYSNTPRPFF